ncbi:hypothetical protein NDI45_00115 [Leptolyngbya sp. GB1-A1]|uniref:hypothetical protein n=1 Tax=Leptolyngbya sp. GB1-A1 TaxID=2933908 RepID=UPI00329A4B0E
MANFNLSETIFGSDSEMAMLMRSRFAPAESNANELKIQTQTPLGSIETWFKKPVLAFTHQHVRDVLGESETNSHAMFSLTSMGMTQTDAKTRRFLRKNAAFCGVTGYTEAELFALTVDDVNHPDDRDRDWESFINLLHGGK